jgi:hypothetical protein
MMSRFAAAAAAVAACNPAASPELPATRVDTTLPEPTGPTLVVRAGDDLQSGSTPPSRGTS